MEVLRTRVESVRKIADDIFSIAFLSPLLAEKSLPGQFLHIKLDDERVLLRRPFSIHKIHKEKVFIIFKVKGTATSIFSHLKKGAFLDVLGPLGNGFSCFGAETKWESAEIKFPKGVILISGGIGAAPFIFLAQKINSLRKRAGRLPVLVLLGAKTESELLCESDFKRLGCKVFIATDDGSKGFKGTVTDLLKKQLQASGHRLQAYVYACGSEAMLRSLSAVLEEFPELACEASFEQFMGCGIGVCCGCAIRSKSGYKKVCREGPVFNLRDIF